MKKFGLLLLTAILCLTLAGCKSKAVTNVEGQISAIGEVTLQSGDAIAAAEDAYKTLSTDDAQTVENYSELENARKKYDDLVKAAEIEKVISEAVANVTIDSEGAIAKAKETYNAATKDVQALVKNYSEIAAAEDKISSLRAGVVVDQIAAIGTVTVDSKEAIEAAQAAYDALSDADKQRVTNYAEIQAAREKYTEARANAVAELISAVGTVTLESGDAIDAANTAYKELTAEEKEKVGNYGELTAAAEELKALKKAEADKLLSGMRMEEDKIRGLAFYYPSAWQFYNNGNWAADKRCFILPYLGMDAKGNCWLRLVYNYTGSDWVFYKNITVAPDGERYYKLFSYWDIVRDNGGRRVWEYIDDEVSDKDVEMLWAIVNSTETLVRFAGDNYSSDFTITQSDKDAIRDALTVFEMLN